METETHTRIIRKAIELLDNKEIEENKVEILNGAFKEDYWQFSKFAIGLPVLAHFYSPEKKRGFLFFRNAKNHGINLFKKAIRLYKENKKSKAFYYLGRAAHILADMATPAHTNLVSHFFKGDKFEQYALTRFLPQDVEIAEKKNKVGDYYEDLARISCKFKVFNSELSMEDRKELANQFEYLTTKAINYSAALILHFIQKVGK